MTAQLIDGKAIAQQWRTRLQQDVADRLARGLPPPGLAVVQVGEDPASTIYVRNKRKACLAAGILSKAYELKVQTSQPELLALIDELNADPEVHGILVQLPLPPAIDPAAVIDRIVPAKDVDGFHPVNMGLLALRRPVLRPCTPYGIMQLLAHTGVPLRGAHAVVVGVSNHVGRPMALELLLADATVTLCNSKTRALATLIAQADVMVAAVGRAELIRGDWIKPGAVVIDVGINRLPNGELRGDVEFESARARAGWITPVPGGVGPMTIAMLLANTLTAAQRPICQ